VIPETTREALLDAMQRFDQELRSTPDWADWEQQSGYKFAIAHEGQLYPVKQIVSMAAGVAKNTFSGGNEANTYVTRKGFTIVPIGDDPTDGSAIAERSPVKINNVPVSSAQRAFSLVAAFKHFRDDPEFHFRVRLRRWRAVQLRQLLSDPSRITLDDFNHEIWVPQWKVYLHGNEVAAEFFDKAIHDESRMAELEAALKSGDLEYHGNAIWGTGSRVYGSSLHMRRSRATWSSGGPCQFV
jgi:hypothetical protein